jgi:uncharacterized protein
MDPQHNIAVVQECYAAFGAGNLARLQATLATDVVWEHPESTDIPWAGRFDGPGGVAKFVGALAEPATPELFEPYEFIAQGDRVVVLGRERFRVKATGKTWSAEWSHVFTVVNGKIKEFREYTDTAAVGAAFLPDAKTGARGLA